MKEFIRPYDEEERLFALSKIEQVSGDSKERFDRVTRIAQRMFAVNMADFSFISANAQDIKSSYGFDETSISRDIALANYALLKNEIFFVPDTTKDERFAGNPLVVSGPKIRFYASYPVHSKSGHRVGVLSIADRQPRSMSAHDQSVFRDLAEMIENELSFLELASIDRLTKVSINEGFYNLAEQGLKICSRQQSPAVAVVFDIRPQATALEPESSIRKDVRTKMFADQMRQFFRKSDVIGRLGNDEFTVILLNTSMAQVNEVITKLKSAINDFNTASSGRVYIEFAYATAEFDPKNPISSGALINMANRSLRALDKAG